MARLMQLIYQLSLKAYPKAVRGRMPQRIVTNSAKFISRSAKDPDVLFTWRGKTMALPFSHQLPRIWSIHEEYSMNLARLAAACERGLRNSTMIDVGANIGDSVAIVRTTSSMPILCVEGDARYLRYLKANISQYDGVEIAPYFVGGEDTERIASIVAADGTAHLEFHTGDSGAVVSLRTLDTIVREHPRFDQVGLLKIDTDGYDLRILHENAEFVRERTPVILFEYDPRLLHKQGDDGPSVYPFLQSLNYEGVVLWDNFGDFLLSTTTADSARLGQLHDYFATGSLHRYMDVAVFPRSESALFDLVSGGETHHLRRRLHRVSYNR